MSNSHTNVIGLLGVVFVTLKLTGFIDWSWWWVTAPFWGSFALIVVLAVIIIFATDYKHKRWYERNKK